MKTFKFLAVAAAAISLAAACQSGEKLDIQAQLPGKAETDSVSYLIGLNFGYFIKANNFGEDLNYAQIKKGMMDFINSEGKQSDPEFNDQFKISPELMNQMFTAFTGKRNAYMAEKNKLVGEKWLEKNKLNDGVEVTASGLQYRIIEEGSDVKPSSKDTVWVQYAGTLIDGTQFDASDPEKEAVRFLMKRVIKGWTEGLQLIGEGGHIELYVPCDLAYGVRGNQGIEPNSTLIFDIKLEKVGQYVAPVETEAKAPVKKPVSKKK